MYYVYLLKGIDGKIYIGYTANLRRRISEHKNEKVYTTRRMDAPSLFYYEAYIDEISAKEREKKLKQHGSSLLGLLKRLGIK